MPFSHPCHWNKLFEWLREEIFATVYMKIWQPFEEIHEDITRKCICFKILFRGFSQRQTESCLAQSVKETQWVIVEGSTRSAAAHWLSHGNNADNLTPVYQTDLRTDCTQCRWTKNAFTPHACMSSAEAIAPSTASAAVSSTSLTIKHHYTLSPFYGMQVFKIPVMDWLMFAAVNRWWIDGWIHIFRQYPPLINKG